MSIPHLNSKEKEAIMREKYMATMKPVSLQHFVPSSSWGSLPLARLVVQFSSYLLA